MGINFSKRIVSNPKILGGKFVIRGTRISIEFILELLSTGMSFTEILQEYPDLKKSDIKAALSFTKQLITNEQKIYRNILISEREFALGKFKILTSLKDLKSKVPHRTYTKRQLQQFIHDDRLSKTNKFIAKGLADIAAGRVEGPFNSAEEVMKALNAK